MGLYGWRLISLISAALIGGYFLVMAFGFFLGAILPLPRSETTLISHLLGFAIYAGTILWVFAVRQPTKAWLTLALLSAAFLITAWALRGLGL